MSKEYLPYTKTIVFASALITKAFHEAARIAFKDMDFEINQEEFIILESIYLNPGIIQIELAKSILMKRSYVCKFLGQLEDKGYIRKEQAIRGKRQIIMKNYITPEGTKIYEQVKNHLDNMKNSKMSEYEQEELEKISQTLFKLASKIKNDYNLKF